MRFWGSTWPSPTSAEAATPAAAQCEHAVGGGSHDSVKFHLHLTSLNSRVLAIYELHN